MEPTTCDNCGAEGHELEACVHVTAHTRDLYYVRDNGKVEPFRGAILGWAGRWEADREVAQTEIGDVLVSTVFLGIDHNYGMGEPILFETMVFGGDLDGEQWRYETEVQALAGHDQVVTAVRTRGPAPDV